MLRIRIALALATLLSIASLSRAEDAPAKDVKKLEAELAKIDASLKKTPDDLMLHNRRTQTLMKLERWDDGYAEAQVLMALFEKKGDPMPWLLLESIDLGTFRVDVRFNMGVKERKAPEMGIVRPVSFQVWKKADKAVKDSKDELVEVIDFELGMMGGKPGTAAFGLMEGQRHKNLGMAEVDMKYKDIREQGIALVKKRHVKEEPVEPPKK